MTRRIVRLAALAALAVVPLSGCRTQPGTAAFVGDHRITIDTVNQQVDEFYKDKVRAQAGDGREALVRIRTLNALILLDVFKSAAKTAGATVTTADVKKNVDGFTKNYGNVPGPLQGAAPGLAGEAAAYATALEQATGKTAQSQEDANVKFTAAVKKAAQAQPIDVNPRFGEFDIKSFLQTFSIGPSKDKAVVDLAKPAGEASPADGSQPPADGSQPPADGSQPPADGSQAPADGSQAPADGSQPPAGQPN